MDVDLTTKVGMTAGLEMYVSTAYKAARVLCIWGLLLKGLYGTIKALMLCGYTVCISL